MSALDILLVLVFTLPLLVGYGWVVRVDRSRAFVIDMLLFFFTAATWSVHWAGLYSLGVLVLCVHVRAREEYRQIKMSMDQAQHLNAEIQLAVALTSLTRTLLLEEVRLDFDDKSDPFVVAMRDVSNVMFKVVFDRTRPVSQAR